MIFHPYLMPLLIFGVASIVFAMIPGLDTVMVLRTSTKEGHIAGIGAVIGVGLGLLVWGSAAAFGLSALIATSQTAFMVLKYMGAAYLTWLGIQSLFRPRTMLEMGNVEKEEDNQNLFLIGLRRGILSNLLNPKISIIILTLYPQFIPHQANVAVFTIIMTIIQIIAASLWLSLLVFLTIPLGKFLKRPKVVQWLDRIAGVIFIGFGIKLVTEHNSVA